MPDWRALVRARLADTGLDPVDELDVVEELAQHVEDRYEYLRSQGWSEAEAAAMSQQELDDEGLIKDLIDALGGR
jgi:putative ABC transport system permease protein